MEIITILQGTLAHTDEQLLNLLRQSGQKRLVLEWNKWNELPDALFLGHTQGPCDLTLKSLAIAPG